jgi:hypothetical protein
MKEELIFAAERAFKQTLKLNGRCWWGYDFITVNRKTYFFVSNCTITEDYSSSSLFNAHGDGPWSVWFLLLCAEAAGDTEWNV